jgi:hypothetical protein
MIKHRKRAPGGGRKPKGEFDRLSTAVTTRMPEELRERLVAAADKNDRSITQEILRRLHDSFAHDRNKGREPAMRALCFLIAEVATQVVSPFNDEGDKKFWLDEGKKKGIDVFFPDWRSDPFYFRAFKLAVVQLLDALQPPGEVIAPRHHMSLTNVEAQQEADAFAARYNRSFESPEARADYAAGYVLASFMAVSKQSIEEHNEEERRLRRIGIRFALNHYGMVNAAIDLKLPKSK